MTQPLITIPIQYTSTKPEDMRVVIASKWDNEDEKWSILHERNQTVNQEVSLYDFKSVVDEFQEGYTYFGGMIPVYWSRFNPIKANFIWGVKTELLEERPELVMIGFKLTTKRNEMYLNMALDFITKKCMTDRRGYEYLWKATVTKDNVDIQPWRRFDKELIDMM